ncbi:MAG TPA: O-methyltransferase [Bacteroidota bacterium]|nr:O-methyltransferase [Bacteroidota bacterium]
MDILDPKIQDYLSNTIPDRDAVLSEMEQYAAANDFPIVGPLVGRLLFLLAGSINAQRILELGSGFGYSAYWFAKAIGKDGNVICTDNRQELADAGRKYFTRARMSQRISYLVGDALTMMEKTDGLFDVIFLDIHKQFYPKAFRKALPRLRKGGLLIADNVLWSGRIFDAHPDADTAGILTFNRLIQSSKEVFTSIIPLRDGVSISIKV